VFYGAPIYHVGIYIGGGQMIEAAHTGTLVRVADIHRPDLVAAGRPGVVVTTPPTAPPVAPGPTTTSTSTTVA